MVFYSNNFIFNKISSEDLDIHLVSEDTDILCEYGIPFNIEDDENEITLSFCYSKDDIPLKWDFDLVTRFLEWMITDDYCEFISEDNLEIIYFLKGIAYQKRLTPSMEGIIDITFKVLSPYGYKHYTKEISQNENNFTLYNHSNSDNNYKPVIKLSNISTDSISLTNETTKKTSFFINNLTNSDIIYIDNLMGTITDEQGNNRLMDSNRSWIELCKGYNSILVDGICDIKIEAYYPIMV